MTMIDALVVRDTEDDRAAALLDEFDSLVSELDAAMTEQAEARAVVSEAETEMTVIEAEHALATEGRNEQERKARLVLALRDDPAYQVHAATARHARGALYTAERRLAVCKARMALVRAALGLLTPQQEA